MSRIYIPTYRSMQYELRLQKLCVVAHFSALTNCAAACNSFEVTALSLTRVCGTCWTSLCFAWKKYAVFSTKSRTRNLTPVTRAKTPSLVTAVIVKLNRGRRNCTATAAVNFRLRLCGNFVFIVLSVGVHYVLYSLNCSDLGCSETVLYVRLTFGDKNVSIRVCKS
jgi:hypothetical protein